MTQEEDNDLEYYEDNLEGDYPEDDLADHDYEPDDFVEEDWESYDDPPQEQAIDQDKKKKSASFNRIVIAGAVAVGFLVFYMQLTGGGTGQPSATPPQPATQVSSTAPTSAETPPAPPPIVQAPEAPALPPTRTDMVYGKATQNETVTPQETAPAQGFMNDPSLLDEIEKARSSVVFVDENKDSEETKIQPSALTPHEVTDAPPMPTPMDMAPPATTTEIAAAPQTEMSPDIVQKLDSIATRLGGIEEQIGNLKDNTARKGELTEIQTALQRLEKRMGVLDEKIKTASEQKPAAQEKSPEARPEKKTEITPRPAPRPEKTAPTKPIAAPQPAAAPPARWVLKSALPGKALVAREGDPQILSIEPGANLPGIGRITDIFVEQGRWVVQGTDGRITQ